MSSTIMQKIELAALSKMDSIKCTQCGIYQDISSGVNPEVSTTEDRTDADLQLQQFLENSTSIEEL